MKKGRLREKLQQQLRAPRVWVLLAICQILLLLTLLTWTVTLTNADNRPQQSLLFAAV